MVSEGSDERQKEHATGKVTDRSSLKNEDGRLCIHEEPSPTKFYGNQL